MSEEKYGYLAEDPRSVAGLVALEVLGPDVSGHEARPFFEFDAYDDPRELATMAAIRDERSFEAYRQREAWVLRPGVEVAFGETNE
jgi:hypothetical protein